MAQSHSAAFLETPLTFPAKSVSTPSPRGPGRARPRERSRLARTWSSRNTLESDPEQFTSQSVLQW